MGFPIGFYSSRHFSQPTATVASSFKLSVLVDYGMGLMPILFFASDRADSQFWT